ncbi:DNA topoisomerase III [Billgrantia ethanolica]|uniref:DNA topoisomerase n=1 Tax=Billgrantia ethanolica TaxID=2733486 RepID=A0ABS9A957_9GAMM|nr:DNA topoisomerase III [Halomonas ethanolica]MCE8005315.1 DNA topoisomerase III [Halomonas ethanolica]
MRVFLCEKPSQARDIAKVLGAGQKSDGCLQGNGTVVTWGFGHLLEQAPPESYDPALKRWALETLPILPQSWKLEIKKDGRKQFGVIRKLLREATEVVVATDADREGETIAREILDYCGYRGQVTRLWLSALDDASIRKALADIRPGDSTYPLYLAGLGRSRADWLVGMNLTRAYTVIARQQGHDGVLSVGRVQTPTLRLVVDRDREIANFVPKPFWEVVGLFQAQGGVFKAKWKPRDESLLDEAGRCISETAARALVQRASGGQGRITQIETARKKEAPPLAMDLATLQQEGSRRFGYGAQQVLDIAQTLYETHKATTYPRTDCRYLPVSMLDEAEVVVTALLQSDPELASLRDRLDLTRKSRIWNDSKITAHHGIIPTTSRCDLSRMSEPDRNLYDLIRRHYLAQFLPPHEYDQTDVVVKLEGQDFVANGRQVRVDGWRELFSNGKDCDEGDAGGNKEDDGAQALPVLAQGEVCGVSSLDVLTKQTTPPKPFTEGTLIAAMKNVARFEQDEKLKALLRETAGIGTEATRAGIIDTLLKRGFLQRKGRALVSTPTGQQLIGALPTLLTAPGMTALWEQSLDEIAERRLSLEEFMDRQAILIGKLVQHAAGVPMTLPQQPTQKCPECGSPMRKRKGEKGPFWGCTRYPDCKGIVNIVQRRGRQKGSGTRGK